MYMMWRRRWRKSTNKTASGVHPRCKARLPSCHNPKPVDCAKRGSIHDPGRRLPHPLHSHHRAPQHEASPSGTAQAWTGMLQPLAFISTQSSHTLTGAMQGQGCGTPCA